ncbi:MAG: restriction endonuclease [Solobacterium sp.]|jgi:restriction system protein|nr:restriction endonuclease [Solobacterium sp.]MCH4050219.1 restriction endonuclease [Solobacterium sp.]MCH4073922.1 restriction endonuclease [Solobacterium sp.]MCI1313486.1 restriction endonuclease [Solobacterium sp.]MCI1345786.1 restriction endonuclease [Solobacterium sp.]
MKYRFSYYILRTAVIILSCFLLFLVLHTLLLNHVISPAVVLELLAPVPVMFFLLSRLSLHAYRAAYVDGLSGEGFEEFLRHWFGRHGFHAIHTTKKTRDYGADLIMKKHFHTYVVQAKRYDGNIGVHAIQEAMAAKAYYKADKAIVVTNRYFTASARTLASVNDVQLIDREVLFGIKPTYQEEKSQR